MARGMPSGILNSGSEIANAATRPLLFGKPLKVSTQSPDLGTRRGGTGTAPQGSIITPNPGLEESNIDPSKPGSRKRRRDAITNPDETPTTQPDAETLDQFGLLSPPSVLPKSKPKPPASGGDKETPKSEIDRFLELSKTWLYREDEEIFADAKDFLPVGVTEAKDVRTDRDMLMMIGGLKLAMGYGTGSGSRCC